MNLDPRFENDENVGRVFALVMLTATLRNYNPGPALREYLLAGRAHRLDGIAFEGHFENILPLAIGDTVDQIVIDWLSQRINGETAIARLEPVLEEIRAVRNQAPEDDREMIDFCLEHLTNFRDQALTSEAERQLARARVRDLRRTYGVPPSGADSLPPH